MTAELLPGAVAGVLVISSTDGCFDAWIERPRPAAGAVPADPSGGPIPVSTIDHIDLVAFAREQGLDVKSLRTTSLREYIAWQEPVRRAFHRVHYPAVPFDVLSR